MALIASRVLCALVLVSVTNLAWAANLLINPTFDNDASGWTLQTYGSSSAIAGWSNQGGISNSGALYMTAMFPGDYAAATQCINITPTAIDAHIHAKYLYGASGYYYGTMRLSTFDVPNCGATYVSFVDANTHILADGWALFRIDEFELPSHTQSVALIFLSTHAGAGMSSTLYLDAAGFGPTGTTGAPPLPNNLLLNPDFHLSLMHWTVATTNGGRVSYDAYTGMPSGGSASFSGNTTSTQSLHQCVAVEPGSYDLYAMSHADSDDSASVSVQFYDQENCAYPSSETAIATPSPLPGEWTLHHLLDYTPPITTRSAKIILASHRWPETHIDHVGFGTAGNIDAPVLYRIGGTVTGLLGNNLKLGLNGTAVLPISSNGIFQFPSDYRDGMSYQVTINSQPTSPAQLCTVTNGVGSISGGNIDAITISCSAPLANDVFANGFE